MQVLVEKNSIVRTSLAQAAKVHYSRLSEQLDWLEQKQYIRLEVLRGRVAVTLTERGREFANKLLTLEE
jgi:DNA-binding MarR family transcriptional regulator